MRLLRHALRCAGHALVVLWLTYTACFFLIGAMPGDEVEVFLMRSESVAYTEEVHREMQEFYGYDQPLLERYVSQFFAIFRGEFGYSILQGDKVSTLVAEAARPTVVLAVQAIVGAILLATLVTFGATRLRPGNPVRTLLRGVPVVLSAVPSFLVALVALFVLSVSLGVMPIFPDGSLISNIVPAIVLALAVMPAIASVFIARVDDVLNQPFIETAVAKGARPQQVFLRHVVKNSAGAVLSIVTLIFGGLISGAVVIETAFSRHGVGKLLLDSVSSFDLSLVQGFVLMTASAFVLLNFLSEVAQPLLDPRVGAQLEVAK